MSWVLTCCTCHKPDAECACEVDAYTREQQRRLRAGIAALESMTPERIEAVQLAALESATTPNVTDRDFLPPSMTQWQMGLDSERMREGF